MNKNPLKSRKEQDFIRRKVRELEDQLPKSPKEHDIREKKLNALRVLLDSQ